MSPTITPYLAIYKAMNLDPGDFSALNFSVSIMIDLANIRDAKFEEADRTTMFRSMRRAHMAMSELQLYFLLFEKMADADVIDLGILPTLTTYHLDTLGAMLQLMALQAESAVCSLTAFPSTLPKETGDALKEQLAAFADASKILTAVRRAVSSILDLEDRNDPIQEAVAQAHDDLVADAVDAIMQLIKKRYPADTDPSVLISALIKDLEEFTRATSPGEIHA
jgi:hypothetical protein